MVFQDSSDLETLITGCKGALCLLAFAGPRSYLTADSELEVLLPRQIQALLSQDFLCQNGGRMHVAPSLGILLTGKNLSQSLH